LLWSEAIWAEARPQRKTKSTDALKKSNQDPLVIVAIARLFHEERRIDSARKWFERAALANPDLGASVSPPHDVSIRERCTGDTWAWWLRFERQHGTAVRGVCGSSEGGADAVRKGAAGTGRQAV
jgi:pre-mRNA-processing factor 6